MRNLNTEELKQVYGGGAGSCASASKSNTGSKSGGSKSGSKTNASKSKG
jgi:bacteriocin-like protein